MKVRLHNWLDKYEDAWAWTDTDEPIKDWNHWDVDIDVPRPVWWMYRIVRWLECRFWDYAERKAGPRPKR